jgi:glutathione S-transferase
LGTLYSFRRCPYAIRARLALSVSGQALDLVEVSLKEKPERMLALSPKGTVPVIELDDGRVLDESLEIMLWALECADPEGWLGTGQKTAMLRLIAENDGDFKHHLDRCKYATRYPGADPENHWNAAGRFLGVLEERLGDTHALFGPRPLLADWAILPFVRQFAHIDRARFDRERGAGLVAWLNRGLGDPRFVEVMRKGSRWAGR